MNERLNLLQPYPFERLRALTAGVTPTGALEQINLTIGEPRHPAPMLVREALVGALDGLSSYPPTAGAPALREACTAWLGRRYGLEGLDPARHVLPVNGTREALFAFAQMVVDPLRGGVVVSPNPFYQIYEGAALLAGAQPHFVAQRADDGFRCRWRDVPEETWSQTRLIYVCSPGNPTGVVIDLEEWRQLFDLADRHGFTIASDECYSEIYFDDARPPIGVLEAAQRLGRGFERLMMFTSLSKRSNVPGMRSGFVAGDPGLIDRFLLYRTYHGSAMSPTFQAASIAAWSDEAHVVENRQLYREKFDAVLDALGEALTVDRPDAGFYLWAAVPGGDDQAFCVDLLRQYNVLVLPGSLLARDQPGGNPGAGFVRIALVDSVSRCVEAAVRIRQFTA
ncbi:MAG: succinyldiaminopimelate transaminase [Burkholderiaceae bacterium]|nr:succinyldiaminopimelate transaminase [Burkholderiaceae bacterium]